MKGLKIKDTSMKAQQGQYGIVFTSWNPSIVQDLLNEISGLNRMLLSGEERYVVAYCFDCGFKNFE